MRISWLPEPEDHPLWPSIRALLERAGEPYEAGEWLWIMVEDGVIHAVATTRLCTDGTAELIAAAGHRMKDWIGLLDSTVAAWARNVGASHVEMRGRKGWARFARAFGWAVTGSEDGKTLFKRAL